MRLKNFLQTIQLHLIRTHSEVFVWFDEDKDIRGFRPTDGGWTINEILEHIALTSRYLMILIDKGSRKALKNIHGESLESMLEDYHYDLSSIDTIGVLRSFPWVRPEHMEPTGELSDMEVKAELINQLHRCLDHLEVLKNGEGLMYKTTMTVNDLGRINVYEYIYFLSNHAARHLMQMLENKAEYLSSAD